MQALRLTNAQIKARSKPNLNARLADALRAAGYGVISYAEWTQHGRPLHQVTFVAEWPFAPARPTWDYRKTVAPLEIKARWQFTSITAPRRWRLDFAWPFARLAIEIDGGSYVAGAHSRGAHTTLDNLKRCELAIDGWSLLRLDGTMVRHHVAIEIIQRAVRARQAG